MLARFDMMVNGGGAVTVRFVRGSSLPANVTVILPWNKIVVLDPVTLLQVCSTSHSHG